MSRFACATALAFSSLLLVAPGAGAHVTVKTLDLQKDEAPEVTLNVPNEKDQEIRGVILSAPSDFSFLSAEAKAGWALTVTDQRIVWRGGVIPARAYASFSFRVIAQGSSEQLTLQPRFVYSNNKSEDDEPVAVSLAKEVGGGSVGKGLRGLAYLGAGVGALAFLIAVAGFFLALRIWFGLPSDESADE